MKQNNFSHLKVFSGKEKEKFEAQLEKQFGIKKIQGILSMRGKERVFLFTGNLKIREIETLDSVVFTERVGIYFAKIDEKTNEIRLSIEGSQVLSSQIKRNIYELKNNEVEDWMMGKELNIKTGKKGFYIIKHKNDFLGSGKISEEKIGNFIPKNRRLKFKEISQRG
jgi:NOL1/NOP2/fmu family ribosome biogenesis protein